MIKLTLRMGSPIWINADRVIAVIQYSDHTQITTSNGVFELNDKADKVITLIRDWHAF